jgi:CheY-like chemotaxis protein
MPLSQTKQHFGTPGRQRPRQTRIQTTNPVTVWRLLDASRHSSEDDKMPIDLVPFPPGEDDIIFVIEADEVIRSALHFILADHSETHSFATLDLALAQARDVRPDLALLGIESLKDDGERAVAEIASRLPGIKIMIVANSVNDPLALKALEWGAHNVLGKPISFDSVHRRVDGLLRRQKVSAAMLGLLPPSAAW